MSIIEKRKQKKRNRHHRCHKKKCNGMADRLTKDKRTWNMSQIKSKDTSIEVLVRKYLYHHGLRYRKMSIVCQESLIFIYQSIIQ